ncbi:MFS transporter [Paenibacillus sp. NPDC058174]|uniref:MFS transporter n=1 Tax=Paenibacillus sp. NPDC058174 TaxID=3346366 RepID=UPI0036D98A9A
METKGSIHRFGMNMTPRVWHNSKIDFGASIIFSLFNVVFNQFFSAFALQQGASSLQVGVLSAAPAIGLLFSPFWASWIERTGNPKPFVMIPNAIGRLLLLLPAFFAFPSVYVATAVTIQLLMGIQAPAYASLVSSMYPAEVRGRLMGYVRVAMGMLMIPLAYLVGSWADAAGPRFPLICAAAAGFASILLFNTVKMPKKAAAKPVGPPKRFSFKEQWTLVKGNRLLAVMLGATMLAGFGNMLSNPLYQIIQVEVLSLSNSQIGFARVSYFTALLLTYLIAGWAIDRFNMKYVLLCGIAAYAIVPMLYGFWGTYPAVLLGNGIQGIGEAIWDIGILSFIFRLAPGREATVFGIHLMLFGIRGSIGPLLGAGLYDSLELPVLLGAASACGWIGTMIFIIGNWNKASAAIAVKESSL